MQPKEFDKYFYYMDSVQSPDADAEFLDRVYKETRGKQAEVLREDFCGTFSLCCEWVKLNKEGQAIGLDFDDEPIDYGREHYLSKLTDEQKERVHLRNANVLTSELPKADISCSLNFSYFSFKDRPTLKTYLQRVYDSLNEGGMHLMDCFGGAKCQSANEEETVDDELNYSYFWDQDSFNPLTNESMFFIHFKRQGEGKRERVFTYDWRMWGLPEIKDILLEVGFKNVSFYWEGTDEDGDGDGTFHRTSDPKEDCEAWVAYIAAEK